MCIARFWNHQNDKKFCQVLVKLQTLYTERCIWDYTNTWRKKPAPRFLRCYMHINMKAFEEPCFSGNMSHLMFFHTCIIRMSNAHKLLFTSSQNSTFSLKLEIVTQCKVRIYYMYLYPSITFFAIDLLNVVCMIMRRCLKVHQGLPASHLSRF